MPKSCRTIAPHVAAKGAARTSQRNGATSRCDYLLTPPWVLASGYESAPTTDGISTDHDEIAMWVRLPVVVQTQRRSWSTPGPAARRMRRGAVDEYMKEEKSATDKLQGWEEALSRPRMTRLTTKRSAQDVRRVPANSIGSRTRRRRANRRRAWGARRNYDRGARVEQERERVVSHAWRRSYRDKARSWKSGAAGVATRETGRRHWRHHPVVAIGPGGGRSQRLGLRPGRSSSQSPDSLISRPTDRCFHRRLRLRGSRGPFSWSIPTD